MNDQETLTILPPGRVPIPSVRGLLMGREVLYSFVRRDVTLRYRQTALGIIWVVMQPLLTALVFALVFGQVAKLPSGGIPYVIFAFAGLLAWNMFNTILTRSSPSLIQNAGLVSKIYFPRMLVPISVCGSALLDFTVSFTFLIVLMIAMGVTPGFAILLLPLWMILVLFLATGIGLFTSALSVRYRDMNYIVPFFMQFLLYASPVAYSASAVPSKYRLVYEINPLNWLLTEFRFSLLNLRAPSVWEIIASLVVPVAVFIAGAFYFERRERSFADFI